MKDLLDIPLEFRFWRFLSRNDNPLVFQERIVNDSLNMSYLTAMQLAGISAIRRVTDLEIALRKKTDYYLEMIKESKSAV